MDAPHLEAHITVDGKRREQWFELCRRTGMKPLRISLARDTWRAAGAHPDQIMCTTGLSSATPESAVSHSRALLPHIEQHGHKVLRLKVEVDLDAARRRKVPAVYYEAHIKLVLTVNEAKSLEGVADSTGLAISRSVLNPPSDDRAKWFLTDRCGPASPYVATAVFRDSLEVVQRTWPNAQMECEAVLLDTNPSLDEGWCPCPT